MGVRGPQPTPSPILQARGTYRDDRRRGEPSAPVECPSCPAWLKGEAKQEWTRQAKQLVQLRVLAKIDRALLAVYCDAWGDVVRLLWRMGEAEQKRTEAELQGTVESLKKAVALEDLVAKLERRKRRAVEQVIRLADRFGFSPAARARLQVVGQVDDDDKTEGKGRFFRVG